MSTITTLGVTGMTCGHCVSAVTKELEAVDGVENVAITLDSEGTSDVTVISDAVLDEAALRAAIDEAGYDVASISTRSEAQEYAQLADAREAAEAAQASGTTAGVTSTVQLTTREDAEKQAGDGEASSGGCGCGGCGCGS